MKEPSHELPKRLRVSLTNPRAYFVLRDSETTHHDTEKTDLEPIYEADGGGEARPTGRILVRFGSPDELDHARGAIGEAGYDVERVLSYAPQAAGVRSATGAIADGLRNIPKLESIEGIENVEPEMLRKKSNR